MKMKTPHPSPVFSYKLISPKLPAWLKALLRERFFSACVLHHDIKKNEKNIFCFDCCTSICPHCLPYHCSHHRLLQIRRYVYQDVIRLVDANKLMDCDSVQAYTTNNAKVVFLNQRPQTRFCKSPNTRCRTCKRGVQRPFLFCCLFCKINFIIRKQGEDGLTRHLVDCQDLSFPELGRGIFHELNGGQMTPDSVLEPPGLVRTSSESGGNEGGVWYPTLACTVTTTDIMRKKRSSLTRGAPVVACQTASCSTAARESAALVIANRRKKAPQRAPLY